jgi:adenine-specific DNA-methyltransferase
MAMSQNLEKLKRLLAELFQLDQAELDFGIYRIMNTKREEIVRFLDRDLLPQVREAFQAYEAENRGAVEAELAEAVEKARELGVDPETTQKVKEIRARLAQAVDVTALENEVYSHLYNFFRRYYQEGDFISLRRYKEGVYAIPYEGEEVKLYWANHDQYYIKTSEYLRNYTFKLPSGRRVHFKLIEADTEKDNNRAQNGNERRFILSQEQPLAEENGELVIRFEYRPHPDKAEQADLNAAAVDRILKQTAGFDEWRRELASLRPTEKNPNRTLLEKHLTDYTARNTFDYFIHKDLGGFLRRELDFYIKNEVMHLDDIESETAPRVEQYLAKIKAIRRIAHKLIDFLAQIENFQKKLWLKKKFVVETQYCVTLDRVPEELYPKIAANDAQREEWVRLFAINEIKGDLTTQGYSKPLTVNFLKANPYLVLDTRHFSDDFKRRLLASFDDIDEQCDGLLIHSENFQALNLLMERYRGQVKCIYIDPPYNTGSDNDFAYKDDYQHGSWLSMMVDRGALARGLSASSSGIFVSTDDGEYANLRLAFAEIFGDDNFVADIIWNSRKSVSSDALISVATNHTTFFATDKTALEKQKTLFRLPQDDEGFANPDNDPRGPWKLDPMDAPNIRENLTYPIRNPLTGEEFYPPEGRHWRFEQWQTEQLLKEGRIVFGRTGNAKPMYKRFLSEAREKGRTPTTLWDDVKTTTDATKVLLDVFGSAISRELINKLKPKPHELVGRCIVLLSDGAGIVLDFFAGSGTTAHAVINLNREDGGRRKYILVEMGEYFDTVLVPRIKKVVYSKDWKDGKPVSREGSSHMFKYMRLESYEDTLNNLELKRTEAQQSLLEQHPAFREDYMLRYMLDVESRGSASLLNFDRFEDPFNYKLDIATGTAAETKATVVDLVETFNYLIGLRVKTTDQIGGVRVVTGTNPQGERVLILWRNTKELDNDALDAWFRKQGYNTKDQEYDVIYVNGDNNLENLRKPDQTWKVRLVEEEFRRLMFEVQDV